MPLHENPIHTPVSGPPGWLAAGWPPSARGLANPRPCGVTMYRYILDRTGEGGPPSARGFHGHLADRGAAARLTSANRNKRHFLGKDT